ncbi:MAG: ribonuclease Y [Anaerolineales bacterium]|nr:MAG: ribonuclease Y [Anaerolineales bacterium]
MSGDIMLVVGAAVLSLGIGIGLGLLLRRYASSQAVSKRKQQADRLLEEADKKASGVLEAARDGALKIRNVADEEAARRRSSLEREDERLQQRRDRVDQRQESLDKREQNLNKRQSAIDKKRNDVEELHNKQISTLERIAALSSEEAKTELLAKVEKESRNDMARVIREIENEANEKGEDRAREIITYAIQRMAGEQVAGLTVSTVTLPSDDMKGRIIGRGGRNIRVFEQAAGVDVVVDDTPETVTISCFDPVRREAASRAMARLVLDGRIHPARIEKVVADSQSEVERIVREEGERATVDAGVHGLSPEILKLLGRLRFRTSYGQNQLAHAIEGAKLAALIAEELGANVELARTAGLLHDIGKAVDWEIEGTHARIGADICRRYGVSEEIINCIEAHHHEAEQLSIEAVIVEAADAISGARPGARRESLELYVKRIRALEEIANSFDGVSEAYAIQAGRQVRIIVKPDEIDDLATVRLSKDIARKLEEGMQYPGQIKVTVIREVRAEEFAK